jgi:hypothetical protein
MQTRFVQTLVLSVAATMFCACQQRGPNPAAVASLAVSSATGEDLRVALQDNAPLYRSGPQQLTRPDAHLSKGTLVRVLQKQFGYSLIESTDGDRLGWVANEALGVPPPEVLAPRAMPAESASAPPLGSASPPLASKPDHNDTSRQAPTLPTPPLPEPPLPAP